MFPSESPIGTLLIRPRESQKEWEPFAEARGEVVIPADQEGLLEISDKAVFEPRILAHLSPNALSELSWAHNGKVTDAAIKHIRHLTGLMGLALWETNIGDGGLTSVKELSNLRWLDIGDTQVTDRGLAQLSDLPFLCYLTLLEDRITDDGLLHLQNLRSLEGLDLMDTDVTDKGAETLCRIGRLKDLRIVNTRITRNGFAKLKRALPECQIRYLDPHKS